MIIYLKLLATLTLGIQWKKNRSGFKEIGKALNKLFNKIQETCSDLYRLYFFKIILNKYLTNFNSKNQLV